MKFFCELCGCRIDADKDVEDGFNFVNDIINDAEKEKMTPEEVQNKINSLQLEINSIQESIDSIQTEIYSINANLASLKADQDQEFHTNQFSERYYTLDNEITKLQKSVWDKESDMRKKKIQIEDKQKEIDELQEELNN